MTTDEIGLPAHTRTLPPTARLIYRLLVDVDRPATADELATWCRCPESTAYKAVGELDESGLVEAVLDETDPAAQTRWRATSP